MKKLSLLAVTAIAVFSCTRIDAPAPYGVLPTEAQVEWQKMEYNLFMHFGPNTFTGAEWGSGQEKADNAPQSQAQNCAAGEKNSALAFGKRAVFDRIKPRE